MRWLGATTRNQIVLPGGDQSVPPGGAQTVPPDNSETVPPGIAEIVRIGKTYVFAPGGAQNVSLANQYT